MRTPMENDSKPNQQTEAYAFRDLALARRGDAEDGYSYAVFIRGEILRLKTGHRMERWFVKPEEAIRAGQRAR